MGINSVTDLRNTDPGQTAFTVRQNPTGGATSCHAVQVTQAATSGDGAGVNVVSNNTSAPAFRARAAGPLMQLFDASNTLKFEVDNTGSLTVVNDISLTGDITVSTLTATESVNVSGASASADVITAKVAGDTQRRFIVNAGGGIDFGPGNGGVDTNLYRGDVDLLQTDSAFRVGGALNVTGYTTFAGGQANSSFAIFGNLSAFGSGKAYRFRTDGSSLDLEATGVDLLLSNWSGTNFDGTQRSYMRFSANAQNIQVAGKVEFTDALYGSTKHVLDGAANSIGFFGTTAAVKQSVSGSRAGNAALASLITALAAYGLVTDGSSA